IGTIDNSNFDAILDFLKEVLPFSSVTKIVSELSSKVNNVTLNDLQEIITAIFSLYSLRDRENVSKEEIVEGIVNAALFSDEIPEFSGEEISQFQKRLTSLLEIEGSISITNKAETLLQEYERVYSNSRVITDVRPVFNGEPEKGVLGVLITHTLKIEYKDINGTKEIYISLDSEDLKNLSKQLSKAEEKSEALQSMLNKANIIYLDPYSNLD
ncbi:hypothetical protein, partial [Scytonema sp. UIC 10036]|uniref:hypothetical protein n=1 Tax=Scytonema sp. UIC 10036 TaxID=2304196 RepID=UPI00140F601F